MSSKYEKTILSKYKSLAERSFKTRLEMFLFHQAYYERDLNFSTDEFIDFNIQEELIGLYELSFNKESADSFSIHGNRTIGMIEELFKEWSEGYSQREIEIRRNYIERFSNVLKIEELKEVFGAEPSRRICDYTQLSDQDIADLRERGLIKTKRSRGFIMEIDRLNSNQEYTKENIVLACYWANNAKTDEFTLKEFKEEIGPAIKRVFQNRLQEKFGDPKPPSYVRGS